MGDEEIKFEIPSIDDIYEYIVKIAEEIRRSGINIDSIVGVSRGGLIPARFMSDFLLIPDIKIVSAGYYLGPKRRLDNPIIYTSISGDVKNRDVLIVDDVADTGETLTAVKEHILEKGAKKVYIAVIYKKPWNKADIDFYASETDAWVVFPWEFTETAYQLSKRPSWRKFESEVVKNEKLREIIERFLDMKL